MTAECWLESEGFSNIILCINPAQLQPCTQFCFQIASPPHTLLITAAPQQQNLKLEITQPTQSAIIR